MLPFGVEPPRWLQEQDSWIKGISSRGVSELFAGASAVVQMKSQALNMQQQAQGLELNNLKIHNLSEDYNTIPQWLQDHPTWDSRQNAQWPTAKTPEGDRMLQETRLRDSQSIQAVAATSAVHDFAKRVDALRQVDPESAGIFAPYITQQKSPEILQGLALAEERAKVHQENLARLKDAETAQQTAAAEASGAQVKTVAGPKGTTTTITSAKPTDADKTVANLLDLGNGITIARAPGGKTLHVINSKTNVKTELTPSQLGALASKLSDQKDPRGKQILDFLGTEAVDQITKPAPATASPKAAPTTDPLGLYR